MVLAIFIILYLVIFYLSYENNSEKKFKTQKEKVKNTQIFCFTWFIITIVMIFSYVLVCTFLNVPYIPFNL